MNKNIEILAPAGSMEALKGAINAGAHAVYLAGKKFGARAYAANFENEDIKHMIHYAHVRGVFVYVAINTVIYNDEIDELLAFTDFLYEHHVDALIIQDLGVLHLLSKRYPDLDLHASTQMNTHHIEQIKFLKENGVKRIVMARETPISVIKQIKEEINIEIEVFVHGALCVCYSGQCLMSSMLGGRSGNRGECAQPCRLPYSLLKNNQVITEKSYLLSTKDLMTIEYVHELINIGVDSLKIEGRMRKPAYVIQAVKSYKQAILHPEKPLEEEIDHLKRVFNREFTKGYLFDELPRSINQNIRPNHLGVPVGIVTAYKQHKVTIKLTNKLSVNDGIRILGSPDYGDRVSRILKNNQLVEHAFAGDEIMIDVKTAIKENAEVLLTLDHALESSHEAYIDDAYKLIPIQGNVYAYAGKPLMIELSDGKHTVKVTSEAPLQAALKRPLTHDQLYDQITKLGSTPLYFTGLNIQTDEHVFIPIGELNQYRRNAIDTLISKRTEHHRKGIVTTYSFDKTPVISQPSHAYKITQTSQYEHLKDSGENLYIEERLNIHDLKQTIVLPRIVQKLSPKEQPLLVHEVGSLYYHQSSSVITSEFFNVTNIYAAHLLFSYGAKRVTLSLELSKERIHTFSELYYQTFGYYPPLEMVVYGRTELMISKYCPIAKTYETKPNCHLCEHDQYALKDQNKRVFPLIHDGHCHLRILHDTPLNLISHKNELNEAHIHSFRIDLTTEDAKEIDTIRSSFEQNDIDKNAQKHQNVYEGRYQK